MKDYHSNLRTAEMSESVSSRAKLIYTNRFCRMVP